MRLAITHDPRQPSSTCTQAPRQVSARVASDQAGANDADKDAA